MLAERLLCSVDPFLEPTRTWSRTRTGRRDRRSAGEQISTRADPIPAGRPRRKPAPRSSPPRQMASGTPNSRLHDVFELSKQNLLLPGQGSVASTPRDGHGPPRRGADVGDKESVTQGHSEAQRQLPRRRSLRAAENADRRPTPRLCGPSRKQNELLLDLAPGADYKPSPTDGGRRPPSEQRSLKTG